MGFKDHSKSIARYPEENSEDEKIVNTNNNAAPREVQLASSATNGNIFKISRKDGRNQKVTDIFRDVDVDRRLAARREKKRLVLYVSVYVSTCKSNILCVVKNARALWSIPLRNRHFTRFQWALPSTGLIQYISIRC